MQVSSKWFHIGAGVLVVVVLLLVWRVPEPKIIKEVRTAEKVVYKDKVVEKKVFVDRIVERIIIKHPDGTEETREKTTDKSREETDTKEKVVEKIVEKEVVKYKSWDYYVQYIYQMDGTHAGQVGMRIFDGVYLGLNCSTKLNPGASILILF